MGWDRRSWRSFPIQQQPEYADPAALEVALGVLAELPPLVSAGEIRALRARLAGVAAGEAYLLQGGDCAERFIDCSQKAIESKLKVLVQMGRILAHGSRRPIVRVARLAGQFAKPRSRPLESVDGIEMWAYRGDHVNAFEPLAHGRVPDPARLVDAYFRSAATLNFVRGPGEEGMARWNDPQAWDATLVRSVARSAGCEEIIDDLLDAERSSRDDDASIIDPGQRHELFTSHEGLLLAYEEAKTSKIDDEWFNLGAHMLWIGNRTRQIDGAHVEYFRGIANPVGVKIGPSMDETELVELVARLDPRRRPGKTTLITRLGAEGVRERLPALIRAIAKAAFPVVWSCDPMHGNTYLAEGGFKTRAVPQILEELRATLAVHEEAGSHLGGVHLEMTGEAVNECTGGPRGLSEADLATGYETYCDPRLDYVQSLEMAFVLARHLRDHAVGRIDVAPGT